LDYNKSREEIVEHFNAAKSALQVSCKSFDEGNRWEAMRLATTVYSLVNDGGRNSVSILTQLGLRASLRFPSRANIIPGNFVADTPLVIFRISSQGPECLPLLNDPIGDETKPLQFQRWWDQTILKDGDRFDASRRSLVFSLRNQDGGAHVDSNLKDEAYVRFSKLNFSTPRMISSNAGEIPFSGIAEASMRHVASELLQGIEKIAPQQL
jgi:hypothetical protein